MNHLTQSLRRLVAAALVLLTMPAFAQLSGTYTIDPNGTGTTNYASFSAAVTALTTSGVSGPVTFNVAQGTYTEQVTINAITGTSATNKVTFKSATSNTLPVNVAFAGATAATNNWTLRLNGVNNLEFDGIKFSNTSAGFTVNVNLNGTTSNIKFLNCSFTGAATSTASSFSAFFYETGSFQTGDWTFNNCQFINNARGINLNGSATNTLANLTVTNCSFNTRSYGVYTYYGTAQMASTTANISNNVFDYNQGGTSLNAVILYGSAAVTFNNNTVNNFSGSIFYYPNTVTATNNTATLTTVGHGISVSGATASPPTSVNISNNTLSNVISLSGVLSGITINQNTITTTVGSGITLSSAAGTSTTNTGAVAQGFSITNNRIVQPSGSSGLYGIYFSGFNCAAGAANVTNNTISANLPSANTYYGIYPYQSKNVNIYHNTVFMTGASATGGRALYVNNLSTGFAATGVNIQNNIFENTGLGYAAEIATTSALGMVGSLSNNVYFGNTTNPFRYNSINQTTLSAWQTATTKDANSVWGDVIFFGPADLHVQNAVANNVGTPIASVTTDMDGQTRSATTPDAGADEYSPLTCISAASITISNLGGNSATASWTTTNTPVSYKVRYRTNNTGAWTTSAQTTSTINLTGLSSNTAYEVQVKEFCSATDSSIWSPSQTFTTAIIPNWSENFQLAVPPTGWSRAIGQIANPTTFTSTSSSAWGQDDYANLVPNGPNGKSARVNIYSTGHFNWLISPLIFIPNNALTYQIEYDIALRTWNATTNNKLGVDDTLALVVSFNNGATWEKSNMFKVYSSADSAVMSGSHVTIPVPTAWKGQSIRFGWYSQSTVANSDNDIFVDNFEVKDNATCPITATPTVTSGTACGPQPVTLTATWANTANHQHIWLSPTGRIVGQGTSYTTGVISAATTQNSQLIVKDNSVATVSAGPTLTATNPAGGGGNFTNGTWISVNQPMILDSVTVKAFNGTINFRVRVYEKAGSKAGNTGALIMASQPMTVTTTSPVTAGTLHNVAVNLPLLPGAYYINLEFLPNTTGTLFRSTALPTGQTYPFAIGSLATIDSVQFGATGTNARVYYLFNWKASKVCTGPVVTTNVNYSAVPSVALPHTSDFATGAPCNWVATGTTGSATWQGKTTYSGNGYTATSLNGTPFVMVDDDAAGSSASTPNSVLNTPEFPALGYDTLTMKFLSVFKGGSWGGKGYVEVWRPVNGVFGWQTIDSVSADEGIGATTTGWAPVTKSYNVTAYQSNQFKARFRYDDKGNWAGWWAMDNFQLYGTLSQTGNVRVAITTDIYGSEVSWKIVNTANKLVYATGGPFPDVTPYVAATATHIDTVALPVNGTYEFRITDSYGDGLTDGTNNGTYLAQVLCAYGPKLIDQGSGALPNDPGGSTANVPSWDSATFDMDCRQPATYKVFVNMSQQTVSANGVHIAGNFQGWNPSSTAMTDANGDGIYEYTINTFVGEKIEYKFINGNAWGTDETVPLACRYNNSWNRGDSIANVSDSADVVCFALCYNCAGVTFQVDMNQVSQSFTTPEVNGLWNNWCGNCNPLTDADGDGIWTTKLPLAVGTTQEYKFSADNWTIQEQNNPAAPCTNGNTTYTNRVLVIPATDTVLNVVCWSQCTACDVDVTLKVNMAWEKANNAISANGVHVAGDFQGWSPSATPMTDANNDGIYEVTINVPANSSIQYKFINGNAWGADESVPSACVVTGTWNRGATFAYEDTTMNPVCFGKCTDCMASIDEALQNVSLFPNPNRGQFQLARMDASTNVEVSILDLQGKVLTVAKWNEGEESLSVDLGNFANGVYMVRLTSEEGSRTLRVSVQK
jgi:Secretion system C-terminal sorting domain/Fibronectin type III domain/Right handed beta helix region/Carbohydrate-binding module 48 (Isoamylase N-terminal domain)